MQHLAKVHSIEAFDMEVSSLWAALNFIGLSLIIGTEISAIPLPGAPERFANVSDDLTFGDLNNTGR